MALFLAGVFVGIVVCYLGKKGLDFLRNRIPDA